MAGRGGEGRRRKGKGGKGARGEEAGAGGAGTRPQDTSRTIGRIGRSGELNTRGREPGKRSVIQKGQGVTWLRPELTVTVTRCGPPLGTFFWEKA